LVEAAPDTELVSIDRESEAVVPDGAGGADLTGLCAGVAVRREEDVRIVAYAESPAAPFAQGGTAGAGITMGSSWTGALSSNFMSGMRDRSIGRGTGERCPWVV
jgi:hypothetical protein